MITSQLPILSQISSPEQKTASIEDIIRKILSEFYNSVAAVLLKIRILFYFKSVDEFTPTKAREDIAITNDNAKQWGRQSTTHQGVFFGM